MRPKVVRLKGYLLIALIILSCQPQRILAQQSVDQSSDTGTISPGGGGGGTSMNFQADLFTGRFTYAVPIEVVPGRQGAQPKLTLGYNSAAGNGWCGVGWTLDTGYIQRDTRKGVPILWTQAYQITGPTTNYLGYSIPLPQYDDSKGFVADVAGAMSTLVLVSGTNQNPIVYRQQVDTAFLTYNYYTNNYWTVVDKSGNTFYFGEGITNQMENTKTNWTQGIGSSTFRWALDKVIDANGNETFLNYATNGGLLYLTNISYNANINSPGLPAADTVSFILTNRPDTNITFISGYRVQTQELLSEIDVRASGTNVCKYALGYMQSPSTLRSLLASVTQYGSDYSTALPPITFNYQVKPFTFGPATNWPGLYSQGETNDSGWSSIRDVDSSGNTDVKMVDIDGDGLPDRVMRKLNSPYTNYFAIQRNTGSGFAPPTTNYQWAPLESQGVNAINWDCPTAVSVTENNTFEDMVDINGDGYPDRVMENHGGPYTNFFVELNSGVEGGGGFSGDISWGPVTNTETANGDWLSPDYKGAVSLVDMNGDGLPDRVSRMPDSPYDHFEVQLNTGTNFTMPVVWSPLDSQGETSSGWNSISQTDGNGNQSVILTDINGDGLPDRVMRQINSPYTNFVVQFNNGAGFEPAENWGPLDSQGQMNNNNWGSPIGTDGSQVWSTLVDINGDGLPDRVMRSQSSPYTNNWLVQLNTGSGFTASTSWGPLDSQGQAGADWNDISYKNGGITKVDFFDINGDGLPDRVMEQINSPYTNFVVQLNQGPFPDLLNVVSNGLGGAVQVSYVASTTLDNRNTNWISDPWTEGTKSLLPFNVWVVSQVVSSDGLQIFPASVSTASITAPGSGYQVGDILTVTGGTGTAAQIQITSVTGGPHQITSYTLLSGGQYTVSPPTSPNSPTGGSGSGATFNLTMTAPAGNFSTNTYAFKGGYYNAAEKEFRGFSQCTVTDPLGTKTVTYFHQSGGRDNSALGEYLDQTSESKKGIPFRIDVIGNDGKTNKITLNKVQEVLLNSNGWYFPFISQIIEMNYEGLSSYRATAKQFSYDTNTENLLEEIDLGEVTNVVVNGQTFADVGSDSVYTWMTYTNFGRPSDIKITSDSVGANRLRETQMFYDSRGNLTSNQVWLDSAGNFVTTTSTTYDQYGNPIQATDAAGITTYTTYDPTYEQYPITQITGTFTNQFAYDPRSGLTLEAIDAKGLVASNSFDVLYRSTASYISTNAYGPPVLWKTKTSYSLGGVVGGISYNCVHKQVNDAVDPVNGFETYTYLDGAGRTVQTRTESETAGQFRVANVCYDLRGNPYFQTLPYFSSGTNFTSISGTYLGALTEYDSVGRAYRVTPAENGSFASGILTNTSSTGGDTGSPVGATTTAFVDGSNPWATVVTDSEGKVKKSYRDAYGRTTQITEVTSGGNYNTTYAYDILGNLTNVTDNAGNSTVMAYDSLGRKTSMTDPDMGTWSYTYDNAGRMTQQIDARGDKTTFDYTDQLGRLVAKHIYNSGGALVSTVTYAYDVSDDPNYTVFKGQLYKVTDSQGYQRSSYDVRGRVVKTGRFLNVNAMEYVTQTTYDDADRVQTITYPGDSAVIQYSYDTGGNLSQVKSLAGTGTQEIFYTPTGGFNALGQLLSYTDGAGVVTTNVYFGNSKRLQRVWVYDGSTNLQDLSYTYDTVSDLSSINDGVYSGLASASVSNIVYDDLYRVASLNSTARGTKTYGYNSIGNVLTNQDFGSGLYSYGAKPHAVTSANGMTYAYDACGNMIARGNQTLTYDEQNELIKVSTTNDTVMFGYDDAGERLWRAGTNGYSVWIGGIYEINNGKVLCHVFAGGKRIATFEPLCGGLWSKAIGDKNWYVASTAVQSVLNWPFQKGRGQMSVFAGTWTAILGVCLVAGRRTRLKRYEIRKALRLPSLWRQAVTFASISAFLWASTGNVEAATYSPVFYYYHDDNLGSSNVLTDRSGSLVQHYEYATFGQTSYQNNTSAYQVSNRYTGQIADDETGLYYYNARYYDSQLGRFIQPDTTVPGAGNPQSLNRYSYVGNNPLNDTDPSGHGIGGFFSSLAKAFIAASADYHTAINAAIGALIGGIVSGSWIGAAAGASYGFFGTVAEYEIAAGTSYYFGQQAGEIGAFVFAIALAAYGIAGGVGMIETNMAEGISIIASSSLAIGSSSAAFAGDSELASDFEYASLATATAGYALIGELTDSINVEQPTDGQNANAHKVGLMGIGQTNGSGAQSLADAIHGPVAWVKSDGLVIDILKVVWRMAMFGYGDSAGKQFAQLANQQGPNTIVIAHSGGAASAVFDALLGRFNSNVTSIQLYSSPVNQLVVDGARWISGEPMEFEPRHWNDISNFYSISLNPAKFVSGLVFGPFMIGSGHDINNYIK